MEPSRRFLQSFYSRYNAPLRDLIGQLDAPGLPLWRNVPWLTAASAEAARGGEGLRTLHREAAALHALLAERGDPPPESAVVGSPRWFGSGPRPSVFVLGARDS